MTAETLGEGTSTPTQPPKRKRSDAFYALLLGTTCLMIAIAITCIVMFTNAVGNYYTILVTSTGLFCYIIRSLTLALGLSL